MRTPKSNGSVPLGARVGVIALLAGLSAGCSSDAERFNIFSGRDGPDPTVTASIPANVPSSGHVTYQPTVQALPAPIQTQPMPVVQTLPSVRPAPVTPVWTAPAPQAMPAPSVSASVPAPRLPTMPQAPVYTGSIPSAPLNTAPSEGWTAAGGTRVALGQNETLFTVSRRYGVPVSALQQANGIADPNANVSGQTIVIPTYVYSPHSAGGSAATGMGEGTAAQPLHTASVPASSAPVVSGQPSTGVSPRVPAPEMRPAGSTSAVHTAPAPVAAPTRAVATSAPAAAGGVYVVQPGDTLYGIARNQGVPTSALMSANGISDANQIRIGQRLTMPGASAPVATVAAPAVRQPSGYTPPSASPVPAAQAPAVQPMPAPVEVATRAEPVPAQAETPAPTNGALAFRWPIRGHVISGFGTRSGTGSNDGINIAVPEGALIRAAEDGEVVYSGNGLRGFGNLVLIQHRDGWVTAYAHNSELLVQRGQRVRRGENIARAGQTGDVDTPQLHFEVRRGNTPVDPAPLLQQL